MKFSDGFLPCILNVSHLPKCLIRNVDTFSLVSDFIHFEYVPVKRLPQIFCSVFALSRTTNVFLHLWMQRSLLILIFLDYSATFGTADHSSFLKSLVSVTKYSLRCLLPAPVSCSLEASLILRPQFSFHSTFSSCYSLP